MYCVVFNRMQSSSWCHRRYVCCILLVGLTGLLLLLGLRCMQRWPHNVTETNTLTPDTVELIFVGGHPSSAGTGLMRVMLDAHPMIRCGAEPLVTFDLLKIRHSKNDQWKRVAKEAGVYPEVYDHAVAAFILKVIEEMGPSAKYLCHKEPVTTPYFKYLAFLFPKSKFVHMLRDGRGVVASSIARHLISGGKGNETERALRQWETMVKTIMKDCNSIGLDRCITIRYEKLVLESELEMKRLFKFLHIPWDPIVLRHETILESLTHLNPFEPSTIQFMKKIHPHSLGKWSRLNENVNEEFLRTADKTIHLLHDLGYSDIGYPPDYSKLPANLPELT
ncbi:hypothetical protein EG68_05148 [Paragonimus skrjabini miyazakii]|uniref:Protein-tyrosine sulfotransferase n=1 Tax=Paragonimus skrjabini miyazakii TaxID=59628 RepID=A0A8S9YWG4_9TREM|nr:hypothetical protein EG68_05148 [Paragonimus skrjabini miyazakii]